MTQCSSLSASAAAQRSVTPSLHDGDLMRILLDSHKHFGSST